MLLLARTTPADEVEKKTLGLSTFLVDMKRAVAAGTMTIRPIRTLMNHATTEIFLDGVEVPADDLVGEEGQGFRYILDGMNAERVLIAAECIGDGRWFVEKARAYASERVVFGRPIGANQGVQFPIAQAHAAIEAADLMRYKAAWLFEQGLPCGAEANMAKLLAAEASWAAANACLDTHGGFGFAEEYDVERKFRETRLYKVAPVSNNLILAYLGQHVLGMPRSYCGDDEGRRRRRRRRRARVRLRARAGGAEVVVLERGEVGAGASLGNTGWVCPSLSHPLPGPGTVGEGLRAALHRAGPLAVRPSLDPGYLRWLWRFRAHCTRERWQEGVRALARAERAHARTARRLRRCGRGLRVARRRTARRGAHREASSRPYRELFAELRSLDAATFRELGPSETREAEPSLAADLAGALLTEVDRWVRPESLTAGLAAWLRAKRRRGARERRGAVGDGLAGRDVRRRRSTCDRVVVAAGIASSPFLAALGVRVALAPGARLQRAVHGLARRRRATRSTSPTRSSASRRTTAGLRMAGVFELGHRALEVDERRLRAMLESADPFFADWRPSGEAPDPAGRGCDPSPRTACR